MSKRARVVRSSFFRYGGAHSTLCATRDTHDELTPRLSSPRPPSVGRICRYSTGTVCTDAFTTRQRYIHVKSTKLFSPSLECLFFLRKTRTPPRPVPMLCAWYSAWQPAQFERNTDRATWVFCVHVRFYAYIFFIFVSSPNRYAFDTSIGTIHKRVDVSR